MSRELHNDMIVIDGLEYSNWRREFFEQLREGGVTMVHATIVYHEQIRETLPAEVEIARSYDRSVFIRASIEEVLVTLAIG